MDGFQDASFKEMPLGVCATAENEYASLSKLLLDFSAICNIEKAWTFNPDAGETGSTAMFLVSQTNLLANKMRKFILSANISEENDSSVKFQWAPFPFELTEVSTVVPSPSGLKLLVVRNPENESPVQFEVWSQSQLEKEFHIPQSVHGSVYTDEWFEGISWNTDETLIAYIAEQAPHPKPTYDAKGYRKDVSNDKEFGNWKGQGEWEEDWGETYAGKRQPALFVINIESGEVRPVKEIPKSLSVGQVVWSPLVEGLNEYLVFAGWPSEKRKLGIKYCYNRPCALYAARSPFSKSEANEDELKDGSPESRPVLNLTPTISSAFFLRFSPDGSFLVFLSSKCAVDSGLHYATCSLYRIDWPVDSNLPSTNTVEVIPAVQRAEDGCFPGLYSLSLHQSPWLSDGCTMILSSTWRSCQIILSVNVSSGEVKRISPTSSNSSWIFLSLNGNDVIAVSSSPVDLPKIHYGCLMDSANNNAAWKWLNVPNSIFRCSEKIRSLLSTRQFSVVSIPVKNQSDSLTKGARKPFEAIFVSSKPNRNGALNPLLVILHGGPHFVSLTNFSKSWAYLCSIGYSLLIVNYRGSSGFGEEAMQSLPGKAGSQDVNDVLTAIDHIIEIGLASPSKIGVLGNSHGGFLTTHLIGQAPEKFAAAVAINPVCNLASMVATTDIPDWCYLETYGIDWRNKFTAAPSADDLAVSHQKSPISHISKVKTPTLFLIGAQDVRVPMSNGLQYARALKERGVKSQILIFPEDVHGLEKPQSEFESILNMGVWFNKYCK